MKILVVTSNYPPDHLGGYELRVKEIIERLMSREHEIRVLTTRNTNQKKLDKNLYSYRVLRKLHDRYNARFFPKEVLFDLLDIQLVDQQINTFQPDLIYLGHIYILTKALLPFLAEKGVPLVLDEGGANLKGAWTERGRWFRFTGDYQSKFEILNKIKPLVINSVIKLSYQRIKKAWTWPQDLNVIINNQHNLRNIKEMSIPYQKSKVIHSGIDIKKFEFRSRAEFNLPVRIVYPARFEPLKGQIDAIKLMSSLRNAGVDCHLALVGPVFSEEYYQQALKEIDKYQLENQVSIIPMVDQIALSHHYQESDILFFPTYHQMGFSRVPLEAMACGCVVISYGGEASDEVIENSVNGYIVIQKDYPAVASIIKQLAETPSLVKEMTLKARLKIEQDHSLEKYIDQVENFIVSVVEGD